MANSLGIDMHAKCMHFACMPNLTIRNMPDDLHQALKERAKRNRRSLNQEAIAELAAFGELPADPSAIAILAKERMQIAGKEIDTLRKKMPRFLAAEEIDAAKTYGRR